MFVVYYEYRNGASYDDEFDTYEAAESFVNELNDDPDLYCATIVEEK